MPAISTIPATSPFLNTLVSYIISKYGGEIDALARMRIILPNQRSCKALKDSFLNCSETPILLPKITAVGDIDASLIWQDGHMAKDAVVRYHAIARIMPQMQRKVRLCRLIRDTLAQRHIQVTAEQALHIAKELLLIIDQCEREKIDLSRLEVLAIQDLTQRWNIQSDFIKIIAQMWPKEEKGLGMMGPEMHRRLVGEWLEKYWQEFPPDTPIIFAGSTGSVPMTAQLMKCVATLPKGEIILPDFASGMSDEQWHNISQSHGQYHMKKLCGFLGVEHSEVNVIKCAECNSKNTAHPITFATCRNQHEEAKAIALMVRESLENSSTCAVVTPDRNLVEEVHLALEVHHINAYDSVGIPLGNTTAAEFSCLLLNALIKNVAPIALLALFKHSLFAAGEVSEKIQEAVAAFEIALLRGVLCYDSLAMLEKQIAKSKLTEEHASIFLRILKNLWPLYELLHKKSVSFTKLLQVHRETLESLSADVAGKCRLYEGQEGYAIRRMWQDAELFSADMQAVDASSYVSLFKELMEGRYIRTPESLTAGVYILSAQEARLLHFDRVIIASMIEGQWPTETSYNSCVNYTVQQAIGLQTIEAKHGLVAHDIDCLSKANEVICTRPLTVENNPVEASRYWLQLEGSYKILYHHSAGSRYLQWVRRNERQDAAPEYIEPPVVSPVQETKPSRYTITDIEWLLRDPYGQYARAILNLKPLEPLERMADMALFGQLVHEAMEQYIKQKPVEKTVDRIYAQLITCGEKLFKKYDHFPYVASLWWPRYKQLSEWVAQQEYSTEWSEAVSYPEYEIAKTLNIRGSNIEIQGRLDRIDQQANGDIRIIDYKTGYVPTESEVFEGRSPQLLLQAWLASYEKQFSPIASLWLGYWKLAGAKTHGIVEERSPPLPVEEYLKQVEKHVTALLEYYHSNESAWLIQPIREFSSSYNPYAHLERISELE